MSTGALTEVIVGRIQELFQGDGVVACRLTRGEQEGNRIPFRAPAQLREIVGLPRRHELVPVAEPELLPFAGVVVVPLPQDVRRREILSPFVDPGRLLPDSARP